MSDSHDVPFAHTFFFDGNRWTGKIDSRDKWWKLLAQYPDYDAVLKTRKAMVTDVSGLPNTYFMGAQSVRSGSVPSFGFRREHRKGIGVTLEQWAQAHGINLRKLAERKPSA